MSHADEIEDAKGLYDYAKQLELQIDELKRQSKTDVEVMGEISRCRDVGFARLDVANRLVGELQKHLGYVCILAERLGPKFAGLVHQEEALHMLDGTVAEARELLSSGLKRLPSSPKIVASISDYPAPAVRLDEQGRVLYVCKKCGDGAAIPMCDLPHCSPSCGCNCHE